MTKTPAMPELPEPDYWSTRDDDTPLYTADQMRAYALAALQSAQPAEVSDEVIEEIARGKSNHIEFARAILALRPQAEPAQPRTFDDRNAKFREENWHIRFDAAVEARRAAQEQLYTERERHTAEVKRLQAEIGRLQSLRPQAVPMTDGTARQFVEWMKSQPEDREPTTIDGALAEFEAHHGITQRADGAHQPAKEQ